MRGSKPEEKGSKERSVLLVGSRPLLLDAVERILTGRGFSVVAKASSGRGALRLLNENPADVVLFDLHLEEQSWVNTFLRRLRNEYPGTVAVVLGHGLDDSDVRHAVQEGAAAAVLDSAHPDDLATAVRQALDRSLYLPTSRGEPGEREQGASELTDREREVLGHVAEGASNAEVARRLWVTEQTVKFHLSNIYRKLGVTNRTEAGRYAQLHGLLLQRSRRS